MCPTLLRVMKGGEIMSDTKKNQSINVALAAGAVGAAVGAAGVLMMDKKNQKKVAKGVTKIREWSEKTVEDLKKRNEETLEVGGEILNDTLNNTKESLKEVKKSSSDDPKTPTASIQ